MSHTENEQGTRDEMETQDSSCEKSLKKRRKKENQQNRTKTDTKRIQEPGGETGNGGVVKELQWGQVENNKILKH